MHCICGFVTVYELVDFDLAVLVRHKFLTLGDFFIVEGIV
jgi:hypothetical protein